MNVESTMMGGGRRDRILTVLERHGSVKVVDLRAAAIEIILAE